MRQEGILVWLMLQVYFIFFFAVSDLAQIVEVKFRSHALSLAIADVWV
jgi:hypothetical protein